MTPWTVACRAPLEFHGILQVRILEQVPVSSSRGTFWPRDGTQVSRMAGRFFTTEPPGKPGKLATTRVPLPTEDILLMTPVSYWTTFHLEVGLALLRWKVLSHPSANVTPVSNALNYLPSVQPASALYYNVLTLWAQWLCRLFLMRAPASHFYICIYGTACFYD